LGTHHLVRAAPLVTESAAEDQVLDSVVVLHTVEMVNVKVVPMNLGATPIAIKWPSAMSIKHRLAMLAQPPVLSCQRVAWRPNYNISGAVSEPVSRC
jgi:hypothetical protein